MEPVALSRGLAIRHRKCFWVMKRSGESGFTKEAGTQWGGAPQTPRKGLKASGSHVWMLKMERSGWQCSGSLGIPRELDLPRPGETP